MRIQWGPTCISPRCEQGMGCTDTKLQILHGKIKGLKIARCCISVLSSFSGHASDVPTTWEHPTDTTGDAPVVQHQDSLWRHVNRTMNCSMPRRSAGRGPYSVPFQTPLLWWLRALSAFPGSFYCLAPRERFVPFLSTVQDTPPERQVSNVELTCHKNIRKPLWPWALSENITFMKIVTMTKHELA